MNLIQLNVIHITKANAVILIVFKGLKTAEWILTEAEVTLVSGHHRAREAPQLQRCWNVIGDSAPHTTALRQVYKVSPLIATLPDNEAHPQRQVCRCQVHETEPGCQAKSLDEHLNTCRGKIQICGSVVYCYDTDVRRWECKGTWMGNGAEPCTLSLHMRCMWRKKYRNLNYMFKKLVNELTPCSRVFHKRIVTDLVQKFPASYGNVFARIYR